MIDKVCDMMHFICQQFHLQWFYKQYLLEIFIVFVYSRYWLDVVMFHCRSWVISRWRCSRLCWWERSCCFIQVTITVMTIVFDTISASQWVPSDGHSLCCPQCPGVGGKHSVAGRSHQLVTGSVISWGDWYNVSVRYRTEHLFTARPHCSQCRALY